MNSIILFKARLVSNFVYDSDRNKNTFKKRKEEIGIKHYNSIQPQGFPRTEWVTAAAPNPPRKPRRPLPTGLLFPRKNLRTRCIRISMPGVKMLIRRMMILQ